jgi:hypothetical protein
MKKYWILGFILIAAVAVLMYYFKMDTKIQTLNYAKFETELKFDMKYDQIVKTFGEPAKDIGSGINIYVYELVDKTQVWIGYAGKIMYARHMNADGAMIANIFDQVTYINTTAEKIIVSTPYPGAVTGKDFSVLGEAAGWYFEASFPVEVIDPSNNILWQGPAQALSDWMTANLVAFKADIKITNGYTGPATLILRKDNPSGEPANDASMSMPINISY